MKRNATVQANRFLTLTLFFYAQMVFMGLQMARSVVGSTWFWIFFILFCFGLFMGTYFIGEYRHYKRLEAREAEETQQ